MAEKGSLDKTIIYTTDHCLDPALFDTCRRWLARNSCGCPIISSTMKPDDLGTNVCVGPLPRSGISIDIQLLAAAKMVKTKWVMLAEHDCLYTEEHVRYIPPDDVNFHYNDNNWLLQYKNSVHPQYDGMFSYYRRRRVQSQLVCDAGQYLKAMTDKVAIVTDPAWSRQYPSGRIAEPGCCDYKRTVQLAKHPSVIHLMPRILDFMDKYRCVDFKTKTPNIDIRHGSNFTGQRRGNNRRWELRPWGTMEDILNG